MSLGWWTFELLLQGFLNPTLSLLGVDRAVASCSPFLRDFLKAVILTNSLEHVEKHRSLFGLEMACFKFDPVVLRLWFKLAQVRWGRPPWASHQSDTFTAPCISFIIGFRLVDLLQEIRKSLPRLPGLYLFNSLSFLLRHTYLHLSQRDITSQLATLNFFLGVHEVIVIKVDRLGSWGS